MSEIDFEKLNNCEFNINDEFIIKNINDIDSKIYDCITIVNIKTNCVFIKYLDDSIKYVDKEYFTSLIIDKI